MVKNVSWQDKVVFYQKASVAILIDVLFATYIWRYVRETMLSNQPHEIKSLLLGMAFMFVIFISLGSIIEAHETMMKSDSDN
ncbi:MAG: hypothetical protein UFS73_07655 [Weissella confusa]|nr:hypothetical protein [Weissella confusa]